MKFKDNIDKSNSVSQYSRNINELDINEDQFKIIANDILSAIDNKTLVYDDDEEKKIRDEIDLILKLFEEERKSNTDISSVNFENDNVSNNINSESNINSKTVQDNEEDLLKREGERIFNVLNSEDHILTDDEQKLFENQNILFSRSVGSSDVVDLSDDGSVGSSDVVDLSDDGSVGSSDVVDLSDDSNNDNYLGSLRDGPDDELVIKVSNVTMEYKIVKEKIDTIKEFVIRTIKRNKSKSTKFVALNNISFEVPKGDRVGIIGFNGAGKSTLLKLLSGVYYPTKGNIETKGKIAPLLELGAGFDDNYSGKSNIFLNGAFLGFSEDFLKEKYDEILEFSELGESINYPVKNYSSGMRAKLGFSIATLVEPDILIIDEILAVGDIKFRKKSSDKLRSLIDSGITVLLVSHSVNQIRDICNKAIWIDQGEIKMMGEVNAVCDAYVEAANEATKDQLLNIKLN